MRANGLQALRTRQPGLQVVRGIVSLVTAYASFYAYSRIPLADAYAIVFTAPLLVTLLSVPLLGEVVGWRRASAIGLGFVGVLIMLQPGAGELSLGNLAAVLAAGTGAFGIILMRRLALSESTASMALYSNLTVVVLLAAGLPFYWVAPSAADLLLFGLSGGLGSVALLLVIGAYRRAGALLIAPFQYSQMVWGVILGLVIWGDVPSAAVSSAR